MYDAMAVLGPRDYHLVDSRVEATAVACLPCIEEAKMGFKAC